MKIRIFSLFLLVFMCCTALTSCGEAKRPVDYPDTTWTCESDNIKFSVSKDGKVTDATMIDNNGNTVSVSFVFTDMSEGKVSITNADETETYFSGNCTYDKNMFSVFVTDIYSSDIKPGSTRLTFKRS
ncbi:MAG: hypothetical protein E7678_03160 [Ruminococcaceae bacterium]|nr:hypothetical protein [Oscillospiraceae bacterium]